MILIFIPFIALAFMLWGLESRTRIKGVGLNKAVLFLAALVGWGLGLDALTAVVFGIALWVTRSPGYRIFGGSLSPRREEYAGTFLRACLGLSLIGASCVAAGDFHLQFLVLCAYPPAATLLAIWLRKESRDGRDVAPQVDAIDGALLGALIAVAWHDVVELQIRGVNALALFPSS